MKHSCSHFRRLLLNFFSGFVLACMISGLESATTSTASGNETDRLALLDFKSKITEDPSQVLTSWNDSLHFCNWVGVTCSPSSGRVMTLNLESQKLAGSIPASVGNLSFLTHISLKNNSFIGEIPQQIGRLSRLQHLNLSYNSFGGQIPTNLTQCTELIIFHAGLNRLVGNIPEQLCSLSKLRFLSFDINSLSGTIPACIGNLSSLRTLALMQNSLQGSIPHEIGLLSKLGFFQVYGNQLTGTVPLSIYNISTLYYFTVVENNLQGQLPQDVGLTLPNIQIFAGGLNNFTGSIPVSLSNASQLRLIDFAQNSLTGALPMGFGMLQGLSTINFDDNKLGNGSGLDFIAYLANCTSLLKLGLGRNFFGGELPNSIANLSTNLQILTLGSNMIHGPIPNGIENLVNLTLLGLEGNYLNGSIPEAVGRLQNLEALHLNVNQFSAQIPSPLGNLTLLTRLFMEENRLEGSVPPSLGNCRNLLVLNLSSNNLSGTIPRQLVGLSSLTISLSVANNSLTGSIPLEVGNLVNLKELHISENKLSGEIPNTLSSCISLERLLVAGNFLQGPIPESLKALRGAEEMDFSHNNLSGQIPEFLGKLLLLKKLDLSYNSLEGKMPSDGICGNSSAISILGNSKLCGGVPELHLPACSQEDHTHSSRNLLAPKVVIPVILAVVVSMLVCSFVACFVIKTSTKRPLTASSTEDWESGVSYSELLKSTDGFSEDNLIGSGSFGSVYKGVLSRDAAIVAVKVLNLQKQGASQSFINEFRALRSIRHRNLLKMRTTCSSVDQQGNDFKAIVFDFMSNGNLDKWLHPKDNGQHQTKMLYITQRLNIAIDVASALEYLHHHGHTPIVHCDLKPSNVLLDDDMTAHVGDFGLASFLNEATSRNKILSELKGSIGYIAPENSTGGQVSTLGDVYSYGILLLEMFTGKRPTDDIFKDSLTISTFVATALPERVMEIVDGSLFVEEGETIDNEDGEAPIKKRAMISDEDPHTRARSGMVQMQAVVSVLGIGLSCSNAIPCRRMPMNIVVNKMHAIRDSLLQLTNRHSGRIK